MAEFNTSLLHGIHSFRHLKLRPLGLHNDITHFVAYDAGPEDNQFPPTQILYYLQVDECNQRAEVNTPAGNTVLSACGGVLSLDSQMSLFLPKHTEPVSVLHGTTLHNATESDPRYQMLCEMQEEANHSYGLVLYSNQLNKLNDFCDVKPIAVLRSSFRSNALAIEYEPSSITDSLQKIIIMMAGLRLFYEVYAMHYFPMPIEIPFLLCAAKPTIPSLAFLQSINKMKLRPSCKDMSCQSVFADFLDDPSYKTHLIVEYKYPKNGKFCIEFLDVFGVLQFYVEGEQTDDLVDVCYHNDCVIGSLVRSSNTYCLCGEQILFEKEVWPAPNAAQNSLICQVHHNTTAASWAGEYALDIEWNTLRLQFGPNMTVVYKTLMIAKSALEANTHYKMFNDIDLPRTGAYFFRPQLSDNVPADCE